MIVINVSSCCFGAYPSIFSFQRRATSEDIAPGIWTWCPVIVYYEKASMCLSGGAVWEEGRVITKTFLVWPRRFFVPVSHLSRWARSTKRRMIPAFGLLLNRWQAARCQVAASSTLRTSCANWIQLARVVCSSSPAGPSIPWIIMFHFRRWTSICRVWCARVSAIRAMWSVTAGSTSVASALRRSLVNCRPS